MLNRFVRYRYMKLTILGCNSAVPANGRFPTSQTLQVNDQIYLIDCGEGTQIRMNELHIARGKINHIFISHLHGDHVFGLIGLLTSYSLNQRKEDLHIYSPHGLQEMIEIQLKNTGSFLSYDLHFHVNDTTRSTLIFSDKNITVTTIPLVHRIPTCGFLFKEQAKPRNIIAEQIKIHNIDYQQIRAIKAGADFTTSKGQIILNADLTIAPIPPRSYAFCSDTAYSEDIIPIIKNVDLLYHETTFMSGMEVMAAKTGHSTAKQAATIAKKANAKQLICGHYSSRFKDLAPLLAEARSVFPNTELGIEGRIFEV